MMNFIKLLFLFLFFGELSLFSSDFDNQNYFFNNFLFVFILSLLINFLLNYDKKSRLDFDILFKYLLLVFKTPNFLINYFVNIFKKIYLYLVFFKYRGMLNFLLIFLKKYSNSLLLWWRPLFKKTSYFGYYRSNRSKWIK